MPPAPKEEESPERSTLTDPDFPESIYGDRRPVSPLNYRWKMDIEPAKYYIDEELNAHRYPLITEEKVVPTEAAPKQAPQTPPSLPTELTITPPTTIEHSRPPSSPCRTDYPSSNKLTILERRRFRQMVQQSNNPMTVIIVQNGERQVMTNTEPQNLQPSNMASSKGLQPSGFGFEPSRKAVKEWLDPIKDDEQRYKAARALVCGILPRDDPPKVGDEGIPDQNALDTILMLRKNRQKLNAIIEEHKKKRAEAGYTTGPFSDPLPLPNKEAAVNRSVVVNRDVAANQDGTVNQETRGSRCPTPTEVRRAGSFRDGGELAPPDASSSGPPAQSGDVGKGSSIQGTTNENDQDFIERPPSPPRIRIKLIKRRPTNDANGPVASEPAPAQPLDSEVPGDPTMNAIRNSSPSGEGRDPAPKRKRAKKLKKEEDGEDSEWLPSTTEVKDSPMPRKKTRKSRKRA